MFISVIADWMISSKRFTHTSTRKIINSIGQYGPAVCLIAASYTGCDRILTVALLTIGLGLNGGIYSGFKINHLDITPRFAGILMSFTNCTANLAGLLAPMAAGNLIEGKVGRKGHLHLRIHSNSDPSLITSPRLLPGRRCSSLLPESICSRQRSTTYSPRVSDRCGITLWRTTRLQRRRQRKKRSSTPSQRSRRQLQG